MHPSVEAQLAVAWEMLTHQVEVQGKRIADLEAQLRAAAAPAPAPDEAPAITLESRRTAKGRPA